MNAEYVYQTLAKGTAEQRRALIRELPANTFPDISDTLVASATPGMVVIAVGPIATKLSYGADPEVGAALGMGAHRRAVELYEMDVAHSGLLPTTLSGLACATAHAQNLTGRSEEAAEFVATWAPYYEKLGENENIRPLKLERVEALLNLNRIDDAEMALNEKGLDGNPVSDLELKRLRERLLRLKEPVTDPGSKPRPTPQLESAALVAALISVLGDSPTLRQTAARLARAPLADPATPGGFAKVDKALREAERVLGGGGPVTELTIRGHLRSATSIFLGAPTQAQIAESLKVLNMALVWTTAHNLNDDQRDCLWGLYLCHSRSSRPSEAADALLQLRASLERARAGIGDPFKRGGVFATYQHLFNALIANLHAAGRTRDLLEAIEAAKGRGLADAIVERGGEDTGSDAIYGPAERLPSLCRKQSIHYFTYWMDEDKTYVVFVAKDGSVHSIPALPLGAKELRRSAAFVDPRTWNHPDEATGHPVADVRPGLAPLISWIRPLLGQGVVLPGDQVCYSGDAEISHIPVHYLLVNGKPLGELLSVSRVHNAFHLDMIAKNRRHGAPGSSVAFVVPAREDQAQTAELMRKPVRWLEENRDGKVIADVEATVSRLVTMGLEQKILHFSVHGFFGRKASEEGPFDQSFLLLSNGRELPSREGIASDAGPPTHLTPRRLLALGVTKDGTPRLTGSHVTLMACVSGLSRKGISGDALGLEWAFIQAGARSLLATHWEVDAGLAAAFVTRFYEHWVLRAESRGAAFRSAIQECRKEAGDQALPVQWGAFSLTGDWR